MADFFDYCCDACGAPFCERVHIMNMALGLIEVECCLPCLASQYQRPPADMAAFCYGYVQARDCFLDPWNKFSAGSCPKLVDNTCYCQQPVGAA